MYKELEEKLKQVYEQSDDDKLAGLIMDNEEYLDKERDSLLNYMRSETDIST